MRRAPRSRSHEEDDVFAAIADERADLDRAVAARGALAALADLPERERRYLSDLVGGFSYREIAERHGVTYTNVNKHLARARARLRAAVDR